MSQEEVYDYLNKVDTWQTSLQIAEKTGMGRGAVVCGLRKLKKSGFIEMRDIYMKNAITNSQYRSREYKVKDDS